jgi:hypothetical protein
MPSVQTLAGVGGGPGPGPLIRLPATTQVT